MPAKRKPFVVYLDDVSAQHLDRIRVYYEKKNEGSGIKVNDGYIGRELIRQKYVDIQNAETQSLTLKKIHAMMDANHKVVQHDLELILDLLEGKNVQ